MRNVYRKKRGVLAALVLIVLSISLCSVLIATELMPICCESEPRVPCRFLADLSCQFPLVQFSMAKLNVMQLLRKRRGSSLPALGLNCPVNFRIVPASSWRTERNAQPCCGKVGPQRRPAAFLLGPVLSISLVSVLISELNLMQTATGKKDSGRPWPPLVADCSLQFRVFSFSLAN